MGLWVRVRYGWKIWVKYKGGRYGWKTCVKDMGERYGWKTRVKDMGEGHNAARQGFPLMEELGMSQTEKGNF